MNTREKNFGFTLIELLVVISIIGMLSSVVLASLSSARQKARHTKRLADLRQIETALQMYYSDYGTFPVPAAACDSVDANVEARWTTLKNALESAPVYMSKVPQDPRFPISGGSSGYKWYSTYDYCTNNNGRGYQLKVGGEGPFINQCSSAYDSWGADWILYCR